MKARANSVINLPAQINNLCQPGVIDGSQGSELREMVEANKTYLGRYYYLFILLEVSGARVSEVLLIRHSDISDNGHILLRGLKGSENRIIHDSQASQFCCKMKSLGIDPFSSCNRFTAYRLLKNIGIGKLKVGRTHESVTHIFRDSYIEKLRALDISKRDLSKSIGHKSIKSTEYYGKD